MLSRKMSLCGHYNSDIQEFYETTLLDDSKTTEQKVVETDEAVQRWESSPPAESPPSYPDYSKVCYERCCDDLNMAKIVLVVIFLRK